MNLHSQRGLKNRLLHRVRRHQSMTALFRWPRTRPEKYSVRPWTAPVIQTQLQDFSLDEEADVPDYSIPLTTPARPIVTRQVASPSTPVTTKPEEPKSPPSKETAAPSDPIWKRLQTIFRKHQEQEGSQAAGMPDESMPPLESNIPEVHPSMRSIQRSPENKENGAQSVASQAERKIQPRLSLPTQVKPALGADSIQDQTEHLLTNEITETLDREPATEHLPQQSVPLEAAWNVQRVEAAHPPADETDNRPAFGFPDKGEHDASVEISQAHDQDFDVESRTAHEGHDYSTETETLPSVMVFDGTQESRQPAEILPPSRPRPSQANLSPTGASIQRKVEHGETAKGISESPPVSTMIGPLPADLWWLLGEKPPSGAPASKINNERTTSVSRNEIPRDQGNVSHPEASAEKLSNETSMPSVIQRQTVSDEPLISNRSEPVGPPPVEETSQTKPDLDDLARRVYAEVRRRLAAEWERTR
jgi:hypothetical protein